MAKNRMTSVLRYREARWLLFGQSTSRLGDGVSAVTIVLLILDRWPGATHLSLYSAVATLALVVFLLFGGAVVDRISRRTILLLSDLSRAVIMGTVALLLATDRLTFLELLVSAFLFGILDAVFMPAATALIPEIVPEEALNSVNAASAVSRSLFGGMLGPALGGILSAWSIPGALACDVATFLISAASILVMRQTASPTAPPDGHENMLKSIASGLRYTYQTKWLFWTLMGAGLTNALLFVPQGTLMPLFLKEEFHANRQLIGLSFAIGGVGWLVGSLIVGSLATPKRRVRWLTTSWLMGNIVVGLIAIVNQSWMALMIVFLVGPLLSYGNVLWESMMQTEVPKELLGRVTSVDWFISLGLTPIGVMAAAALSTHLGVRSYFLLATLVCVPFQIFLLISKRVNAVDATRVAAK